MKTFWIALFTLLCFSVIRAQPDEPILEQALFDMPDISFRKLSKPGDNYLQYGLKIRQPLDHQDPSKGTFFQQVILTHRGFDNPTVMITNGYDIDLDKNEITEILHANELNIEYRYFGASSPDLLQWEYLTYEQVAADLHRINQMFKKLYRGKWISSGISRGGQTSIIYRYFYPRDVDLSVPYVAPMIKGLEDERIFSFLDTMGTDACRNRIHDFQLDLLKKEKEILDKLKWYTKGKEFDFNYLGNLGKAFEYAVLEYPFSFWQVTDFPCDSVPRHPSVDEGLEHLLKVVNIDLFADESMQDYAPHYYQALTEGGYYGYDAKPFTKYLRYIMDPEPSAIFPPQPIALKPFTGSLMDRIINWLYEEGNNFLYIYGGRDTWSACRVEVSPGVNSKLYVVPGANHFKARIKFMPPGMQEDFSRTLENMIQIKTDLNALP